MFKIPGLEAVRSMPSGAIYKLAGDRRLLMQAPPVRQDGSIPAASHEAAEIVLKACAAVAKIETARTEARGNRILSNLGQRQLIDAAQAEASDMMAAARAAYDRWAAQGEGLNAQVYTAPTLAAGDTLGALQDREIRDYVRSLGDSDLPAYAASLTSNLRHAEAILRSPTPMAPMATVGADRAWREFQEANNPRAPELAEFLRARAWGDVQMHRLEAAVRPLAAA